MTTFRAKTAFNVALGLRIRQRREELGYTLTSVAEGAEVSKGHLSQVENGRAGLTLWTAAAIARELGWTLDQMTKDL